MSARVPMIGLVALAVVACGGADDPAATPATSAGAALATVAEPTAPAGGTSAPTTTTSPETTPETTRETTMSPASTTPTPGSSPMSSTPDTAATTPPTTTPPSPPASGPGPVAEAPSIREIIDDGVVMNLAHAGGDQAAPHSTPFAFAEAVEAGANALELDVQLTADGVLVVQHDDTVDKTTEATGRVADLAYDELRALDNAYWFSPECWPCHDRPADEYVYRGVRTGEVAPPPGYTADDFVVPTFREIATRFPGLPLDIEIKGGFPDAIPVAEALARELAALDRGASVVVVSFDDRIVDAFHELAPDVAVSPGLGRLTEWFLHGTELAPHFEVLQLPPFQGEIEVITPDVVQRIHDERRIVWVWPDDASTQENEAFYRRLLAAGVDGVIAGRPAAMSSALAG